MNLVLLAGNSLRNKSWIYEVETRLSHHFSSTMVHQYAHWENGRDFIDFDHELLAVTKEIADLQPYSIFAKSVGSVLSLRGIAKGNFKPHAVLITGLPLKLIQEKAIPVTDWLQKITVPVSIAQNKHDPLGSYEAVQAFIKNTGNKYITMTSLPGDTHEYDDYTKLNQLAAILTAS